jgi:hypothetical protein
VFNTKKRIFIIFMKLYTNSYYNLYVNMFKDLRIWKLAGNISMGSPSIDTVNSLSYVVLRWFWLVYK